MDRIFVLCIKDDPVFLCLGLRLGKAVDVGKLIAAITIRIFELHRRHIEIERWVADRVDRLGETGWIDRSPDHRQRFGTGLHLGKEGARGATRFDNARTGNRRTQGGEEAGDKARLRQRPIAIVCERVTIVI